ncbi:hypothetical protein ABIA00_003479 [Bradyrhizobium ottawaense]
MVSAKPLGWFVVFKHTNFQRKELEAAYQLRTRTTA